MVSDHVDVGGAGKHMVGTEGLFLYILQLADPTGDQYGFQPSLKTGQNIGTHVIADNHGIFGMTIYMVQRRADDPTAGFSHVEGSATAYSLYRRAESATGGAVSRAMGIRVGGNKTGAIGNKAGGLVDHVPVVGASFADDNKVGVDIGNGKAGLVKFVGEGTFTYDKRLAAFLVPEKVGGRHGRGIEALFGNMQPGGAEAVLQIFARLYRIVGQDNQGVSLFQHPGDKLVTAGD